MEENKINDVQINEQKNNNNERKGRGLFYFVIAIAIVIIAVVGATYAYFTATSTSNTDSITAGSSTVSLGLTWETTGMNQDLIPVEDTIAKYAYAEQKEITYTCDVYYTEGEDGHQATDCKTYSETKKASNSTCIDDSGAEVCSAYTFTVTNNNQSSQTISMALGTTTNSFENLYFAVYTDTDDTENEEQTIRTRITEPTAVSKVASETAQDGSNEVIFTPITVENNTEQTTYFKNLVNPTLTSTANTKTYTIVMWIHEIKNDIDVENPDQTEADGNKAFTGYVKVTSGDGSGITGVINAATTYEG